MKVTGIQVLFGFIILSVIVYMFQRTISINLMFFVYDVWASFGLYWRFCPEYCSPMKNRFTPAMPLEYYAEFNKTIFDRIPGGENSLHKDEIIRICDRNLAWLKQNGELVTKAKTIPIIYIHEPDFKEKALQYVKQDIPFVMRGIELDCWKKMKIDSLMNIAGDRKVYMNPSGEPSCPSNTFVELRKIYDNLCYLRNCTNLFYYYPDLLPDSDMDRIKECISGYMQNDSKQLFLGIKKGTGTELHAAYTHNFFLMIQGKKKWTFFNPNQLALLYPHFHKKGIYIASESRFIDMDTRNMDAYPLIKYAERYELELQEKDILFNPMSWFHSVLNTTEVSVACSTRWSVPPFTIPDAHLLRYGHMINPELRDYAKDIYISTGILGISQIDEHKHMIGENDPDAIPFWDKYTNDAGNLCREEACTKNWHKV